MEILDSHFHLYSMKKRGIDTTLPENLIGIDVGTDPYDYEDRKALIPSSVDYSHAAGPWCTSREDYTDAEDFGSRIRDCFSKYKGTFLGEIGLDYHWMYGTKEKQIALFMEQLEHANELSVPVIIHSRDADEDLVRILKSHDFKTSGIMHCFSSDRAVMEIAVERGLYISFSGNVTYPSNRSIQDAAIHTPADRLLYETDSPYLAPVPLRGKPCRPEYTQYTSAYIAELRNMDVKELRNTAIRNFKILRSLSKGSLL